MSELLNANARHGDFRRNLLTNASLLALLGYLGAPPGAVAAASDEDRPTVWIELGGQLEQMSDTHSVFAPSFVDLATPADRGPMLDAQQPSRFSIGGEGKVTFAPEGSNWVFSASVRYGRSNAAEHRHKQTNVPPFHGSLFGAPETFGLYNPLFGDGQASSGETHAVLDFTAGRDVGLGLFGAGAKSVVSAGVRYAQFTSSSNVTLHARPVYVLGSTVVSYPGIFVIPNKIRQTYAAVLHAKRNAHAIGPSVSWDASVPVAGSDVGATLAFDWGVNAAVLFGRQNVHLHHQTSGTTYRGTGFAPHHTPHTPVVTDKNRSRAVTIPNVGGFAGASLEFRSAKVSLGYRADFFFGAMDGGIDAAKKENVGFYGPFASISVGLGG
jgi:hypothetical protein